MPDVVRACVRMTGAGVAIAVLPYALAAGAFVALERWSGGNLLGDDDLTGGARVLLLCTLVATSGVVALGVREAWRVRGMHAGGPRPWLAVVAVTVLAWCWPPLWFFTTPWMFVGVTLAVRPLWWSQCAWGDVTADDARQHLRVALTVTAAITVLVHVTAWLLVFAIARPVPPDEFARVEAIRRGDATALRDWERRDVDGVVGQRLGAYDLMMVGTAAAGRSVGGDMTHWFATLGYWPELARRWIAPFPEGPTARESWWIAAIAFVTSVAFWTPLMLAWTWIGAPDPRRFPPAGDATATQV